MCSRLRVLGKRGSAWSEIPMDAASEMIATFFLPKRNSRFSRLFTWSWFTPGPARISRVVFPSLVTSRCFRPVISATFSGPKAETIRSSALPGMRDFMLSSLSRRSRLSASTSSLSSNARCFSSRSRAISCGVLTSPSSSLPNLASRSAASFAFASPVDIKPMTTHMSLRSASSASRMANLALIELSSCLKQFWCALQYERAAMSLLASWEHRSNACSISSQKFVKSS
mmetsp:Transcript_20182/g.48411  ORF Transcript_20182/g.48411 Transcript_20182/m.48411 type:complete len:228 (-) Transcript_20182:1901-2584(-)